MASTKSSARRGQLKVAVIGDKQVGKTSLISRYVHDSFSPHYTYTQGGDIQKVNVSISNVNVQVTIVDAAGHEYVRTLIKTLYRDVHAIMVVFDLTRVNTFESIGEWLTQIDLVNNSNPVIFLVGNKQDVTSHRAVPYQEAETKSQHLEKEYYETSARTGYNVKKTFSHLMYTAWQQVQPRQVPPDTIVLTVQDKNAQNNKTSYCCSIM